MKNLMTFFLVLFVSMQVFAQKKGKVDPKDIKIDSLTQTTSILTLQLDSVSKELVKYQGVYSTLKDKVFKYDFDPAKTSTLIDSLRTSRDSTFSISTTALKDSLSVLELENRYLKSTLDSLGLGADPLKAAAKQEQERAKAINDLKELKGLLDTKIITQQEFDIKKKKLLDKL